MLSGRALVYLQMYIVILYVTRYCVPMDDQRPISEAEKAFFGLGTGSGTFVVFFFFWKFLVLTIFQVPVVLIFTKFDALEDKCYNKLRHQGKNHQQAKSAVPDLKNKIFQEKYLPRVLDTKFPPKTYVCLAGNIWYSVWDRKSVV